MTVGDVNDIFATSVTDLAKSSLPVPAPQPLASAQPCEPEQETPETQEPEAFQDILIGTPFEVRYSSHYYKCCSYMYCMSACYFI